jgi:hypothetical protein
MNQQSKNTRNLHRSTYAIPDISRFKTVEDLLDTDEDRVLFGQFKVYTHKEDKKLQKQKQISNR